MMLKDTGHRKSIPGKPEFEDKVLDIRQLRREKDHEASKDQAGSKKECLPGDVEAEIISVNHIIKQRGIDKAVKELRERTGLNEEAARDVVEQLEKKRIGQRSPVNERTSRKRLWYSMIVMALISLVKAT